MNIVSQFHHLTVVLWKMLQSVGKMLLFCLVEYDQIVEYIVIFSVLQVCMMLVQFFKYFVNKQLCEYHNVK